MSEKMAAIFFEHTGHVLGALTRTTDSDSEPETEAVVGSGLVVRNPRETNGTVVEPLKFSLPAAVLAVKNVPQNPAVLAAPQQHIMDGGIIARLGTDVADKPQLETAHILIKTPIVGPALNDLKVWAAVTALDPPNVERRIQTGTIPKGADPAEVKLELTILPEDTVASIPAGRYGILVAVEGRQLLFTTDSVP